MVPSTADRGDAVTRLQEERSGVRGAEERRGGAAVRRLRAVRWGPDGPRDGASLRSGAPARELLPAVIQAQGEASRGREGHQTLSSAGHTVRTCPGTSETRTSDQAPSARDLPHSRSRATAGRDPSGAGGTRR